ncbi:conserved hypothetical protein [Streptomyces misionensis JCM 4497]
MRVRSLVGVKCISRSLGGMNHLGSGHVLMNNRQPGREDRDTRQRETVSTQETHYGTFAANRQQTAAPEKFFRKKATSGNVFGLVGC